MKADAKGAFYEVIDLKNGENIINITAKAPFKSKTQTYVTVNKKEDKDSGYYSWSWNCTFTQPS